MGIASGLIENDKITSSSYSGSGNEPWMARLNVVPDKKGWCAAPSDSSPYLHIDLGRVVVVNQIAVAGKSGGGMVTTFKLSSSNDGGFWRKYTTVAGEKVTNTAQPDLLSFFKGFMMACRYKLIARGVRSLYSVAVLRNVSI